MRPYLDYLATVSNEVSFYFLFCYQCDISKLSTLALSSSLSPQVGGIAGMNYQVCPSVFSLFLLLASHLFTHVCMCACTCMFMSVHMCVMVGIWRSDKNLREFTLSTMLVLKTQFRSSGLVANIFTHWAMLLALLSLHFSLLYSLPLFPLPSFFLFLYLSCSLFIYLPASLVAHCLQLICYKGAVICQDCFTILRWQSLVFQFSLEIMDLFIYFALLCNFFPECQR